jgi:hypothetical protein
VDYVDHCIYSYVLWLKWVVQCLGMGQSDLDRQVSDAA